MTLETTTPTEAIELTFKKYIADFNIHDAKAFASHFTEDADFTNVFGKSFHGRVAVEAQHAPIFVTMFKNSFLSIDKTSIRLLTDDLAAVDIVWTMTAAVDPKGNPWSDRKGLMSLIMKEQNENWSILIMHNMDLPVVSFN